MNVSDAIKARFSVRKYKSEPVPEAMLKLVLEAGRLAPTAKNLQELRFLVVTDEAARQALVPACMNQRFVARAGAVIVGCALNPDYVMPCGQPAYIEDISIAMSFMMLQATELGFGTCWLGAFDEAEVKSVLGIPDEIRVPAVLTLGVPDEPLVQRARKGFDEIVCWQQWS